MGNSYQGHWGLFSLSDEGFSVFVNVSSDGLSQLLLQSLDFESLEVSQLESPLLLLDALAQSDAVESLNQSEFLDFLAD